MTRFLRAFTLFALFIVYTPSSHSYPINVYSKRMRQTDLHFDFHSSNKLRSFFVVVFTFAFVGCVLFWFFHWLDTVLSLLLLLLCRETSVYNTFLLVHSLLAVEICDAPFVLYAHKNTHNRIAYRAPYVYLHFIAFWSAWAQQFAITFVPRWKKQQQQKNERTATNDWYTLECVLFVCNIT